jgi:2-succinyl-5-enolpyruvyl-6-hydroxy-3-cyclohexene-1-carboxylate synthase
MIYSKKVLAQIVIHACEFNGIETVVVSPGSRNAPLSIGFHNNPKIKALSIVDERSAAFFALGIAQQSNKPVALVCTSGSALLNYYPAIAEAFFSGIPLVILSADRPKHLLNIGDGQTINQNAVFKNHILESVNLIEDAKLTIENFEKVDAAILKSITEKGPVHINIPFDEPLYETTSELIDLPQKVKPEKLSLLDEIPIEVDDLERFSTIWNTSKKKLVLVGVHAPSELIQTQINHLLKDESVLVFTETTSNVYHKKAINSIDKLIAPLSDEEFKALQPDILLSFGSVVVSKKIKQFLREYQPKHHWHVGKKMALNTYHCLSHHFNISAELFFSQFFFLTTTIKSDYQSKWLAIKNDRNTNHDIYLKAAPFSDLKVFNMIIKSLPNDIMLQLSNSSIVRYSQLFDIDNSLNVFCNRGTSGIDGSTSTAIGAAYYSKKQTVFITGDISFFYDSNALWNATIKSDFRIILINNSGGGIFRFIKGPLESNAVDFFETPHNLSAEQLCKMFDFAYSTANSMENLEDRLRTFYQKTDQPQLLEIFTPREVNDVVLKKYFTELKR